MIVRTSLCTLFLVFALSLAPAARAAGMEVAADTAAIALPAAAATATAPAAAGKPPAVLDSEEVFVTAERLERNSQERTVIGEGAVTIRHREMRMVADRVVYSELTKEVVADGNVVLDSGADRLQGEHLELNLDTRMGFLEHAQGFLQTYYFTSKRIDKLGPDHYSLSGGTFTTCEGVKPDWSIRATSTYVTVDEYLQTWNPSLWVKRVPILYFPYAVFPVKRDRSSGLLIPVIGISGVDGFTLLNEYYWAPRENFDATLGLEYLQKTGFGATGEMRYLLAPRSQGVVNLYFLQKTTTDAQRWALKTRNSQELPFGLHAEIDAFFQSDREFLQTQGKTIEARSSERTTSSFYINRSWSAWNFALSGRNEVSQLTESKSTLTRFPELTIDRTSTRLFGTDLFLKLAASGVSLKRDDTTATVATDRLNVSPEMTWPLSLGSVARIIPTAGTTLTYYTENTVGDAETRTIPYYKLSLEGPRPYRIWDLADGGRFAKVKHLIEPSFSYVYVADVDQSTIPRFDSLDYVAPENQLEYSLTNTLYAKTRVAQSATKAVGAAGETGEPLAQPLLGTTQELFWFKLSQSYTLDSATASVAGQSFSAMSWEARTRVLTGLEFTWRGNFDVYGDGFGYQNLSLTWKVTDKSSLRGDWRSTRDSNQDFLDLGGTFPLGTSEVQVRSRYNLAEKTFVENRIGFKYISQCWDVTLGYVHWTDDYEYSVTFALKGIGTIVKI